jgi:dTDP-4-dehydrorhamnose 3,5-epimerase
MKVIPTAISEVLIIEPKGFGDHRGFFLETFNAHRYLAHGIPGPFVQDNLSRSSRAVPRGLHLQNPTTQGKLVTVLRGRVRDITVDVRLGSLTFGQHVAVDLNGENRRWVSRGFAHGFVVLSESADFFYKCDELYSPPGEIIVRWNDPTLGITWGVDSATVSGRDAAAPLLADVRGLPTYGQA